MKKLFTLCFLIFYGFLFAQSTNYYKFQGDIYDEIGFQEKLKYIEDIYSKQGKFKYTKANYKVLSMEARQDSLIQNVDVYLSQSNTEPFDVRSGPGTLIDQPLPDFQLASLASGTKSKKDYLGKVTLVNLWFTKCAPCISEIQYLNHLKEFYGSKVNFIAITYEKKEILEPFLVKRPFQYEHLVNADSYIKNDLKNTSYPKILILDATGVIRHVENSVFELRNGPGSGDIEEILKTRINALLKK